MKLILAYLAALGQGYTYHPGRNAYLWFGILWGIPVPCFSLWLDLNLGHHDVMSIPELLREHPVHLAFLAHPLLFAVVFGAMGTLRRNLETENQRLIDRLTALATLDSLTGLRNRRVLLEELTTAISRAARSGPTVSVVLFDLDGFKAINDEQGHLAGDEVLRKVGEALRQVVRMGETLGRYGGDEFLLVANGPLNDAQALIARANAAMRAGAGIGASAGVARYPADGRSGEELVRAADARLQQQKRASYETRGYRRHGSG